MSDGDQPQTLVLRFRDLATEPGETIERHHAICSGQGRVWWGWWHKAREHVPTRAFEVINEQAEKGSLEIYLLNAHEKEVYRAKLSQVRWRNDLSSFPTPDASLTPDYYRGRRCKAWFLLTDLEATASSFEPLSTLVQVSVPDFFRGAEPPEFAELHGTHLESPAALDEQNRTIWFVRKPVPGEAPREADAPLPRGRAYSGPHDTEPSFPPQYFLTEGRRLLWLSDLHFAEGSHRDRHGFAYQADETPYAPNLHQQLEWVLSEHEALVDVEGVIISGDITWKAHRDEFAAARTFIRELIAKTGKTDRPERVALCPGNHDLRFSDTPWDKGSPIAATSAAARREFETFYQRLFATKPNQYLSMGRRFLLGGAVPVEIVCLNSSLLQQDPGAFQGHGFIGQPQLRHAAAEAGWGVRGADVREPRAVRIVVVHHHLLPVIDQLRPERQGHYSTPLDAEALARWLVQHRVDLVLHGHMHQPFCVEVHRGESLTTPRDEWHTFTVCGLGSSGVASDHRPPATPNLAATLKFNTRSVTIEMFAVSGDGTRMPKHAEFDVPIRRVV